jgi:glucose-6-phosphate dehydrogenase-like protein
VIRPPRFDSRLAEIAARLGAAGLADQARVIVEKPFGRDLAGVAKLQEMPMVRTRLLGGASWTRTSVRFEAGTAHTVAIRWSLRPNSLLQPHSSAPIAISQKSRFDALFAALSR